MSELNNNFQTGIDAMEYIDNIILGLRDTSDVQQKTYLFLELMTIGNDMLYIIIDTQPQLVHNEQHAIYSNYIKENYSIINRTDRIINQPSYNRYELINIWFRFNQLYNALINHPDLLHNDIVNNLTMVYEEGEKFINTTF